MCKTYRSSVIIYKTSTKGEEVALRLVSRGNQLEKFKTEGNAMKKRILALLLTAAMALSVAGCGSSDAPAADTNAQPTTQATEEKKEEKKK